MACSTSRPSWGSQHAPSSSSSSSQPRASAHSHRCCHPASLTSRAGQPSRLHASVAEAADTGVEQQQEAASTSTSAAVRPTPAVAVFPAPAASRLLNDNRAFVEWHRCVCACE